MRLIRIISLLTVLIVPTLYAECTEGPVWFTYPAIAKAARVQGKVVFAVELDKDAKIQTIQLISGGSGSQRMLVDYAKENLQKWVFHCYNNTGAKVEITYEFVLNGQVQKDRMEFDYKTKTITITTATPRMQVSY